MNWCDSLAEPEKQDEDEALKATVKTGRPLGSERSVEKLEVLLGRTLKPKKRGRKRKARQNVH